MRTWLIALLGGLIFTMLAVPLGVAWYVLYTEPGINLLVRHLPQHFAGVDLTLSGVRGDVVHGLHVDHLKLLHRRVHLDIDGIDVKLALAPAFLQTVHARSLKVSELRIEVIHRTTPYVPAPLYFLPHWLNVQLDALHIDHGTLITPNGRVLTASALDTHGLVQSRVVHFYGATLHAGDVLYSSHAGVLRATTILGVAADLGLDYHVPGEVPWRVRATGDGDLNTLPFTAHVFAPFQAVYTGRGLDLTNLWHFDGNAHVTHIALDTWGGSHKLGAAHGDLALTLDAGGFTARGPVVPEALEAGVFDAQLTGSYAQRTLNVSQFNATHKATGTRLNAIGTASVEHGGPRLNLTGGWTHLAWPLVRTPALRSESGSFAIAGIFPYDFRVHADLTAAALPPLAVTFTSALYPDHIEFTQATASGRGTPLGTVTFTGQTQWQPQEHWSAQGSAADLDPAAFAHIAAGRLSFGFAADGAGFRPGDDFSAQVQNLGGVMHNLPARGSGRVSRQAGVWHLEQVRATLAGTTLALDGVLGAHAGQPSADVKFEVRSPELAALVPNLKGHISGSGRISGDWHDPAVQASLVGGALEYDRATLAELTAHLDFDPQRRGPSQIELHARGFTAGTRTVDDLKLELVGEERNHQLDLAILAHDFNVKAHGSAGFANGEWRGLIRQMTVIGGEGLNLALEQPVELALSSSAAHLDRLCLAGSPAHLCASGEWSAAKWSAQAAATELPMQTLTAGQSGNIDYRGIIGIEANLHGGADAPAEGTLDAKLTDAQLRHRLAGGKIEVTTLGSGDVLVNATAAAVDTKLELDAAALGSIKGELVAQRDGGSWREMPVAGSVALQTAQLDFVPLYVPDVDRAAGRLVANLEVAGTVGAPLLSGSLSLAHGELDLYQINLAMREATLNATLASNRLDFDGAAQFGAGHAAVKGGLEWREGTPHGTFTLKGTQLRVADVPEAQIDASPDLAFNIDGTRIAVTGSVVVPRARIVPADLTHAVLASSDEVIVGTANPTNVGHYHVTSDVTMTVGDDVTIEGLGLKARLSGSITEHVASDEQVTHATGEFKVAQGDYTAYGRKLEIERGRLIFTGGPIGDPGVDVRAVKHFDDPTAGATMAGINVRGTLRQPQLSFFSEPPLSQQQIVSLLLAGGGLAGGQTVGVASTNASRGATNNELLGQGAAIIGQQLGSHIGITDVGVESNIYNETSLVLGRYLSPRLYVSYGLGLTQTLNTVKLRYTLGDHWMIRTEAGQVGGADLVYTLDK